MNYKTYHLHAIVVLLAALMASCSSDSFKIEGELTGLDGTTTVRVTFSGDSGIVDDWANVDKKGHFTFKGQAAQPTLVGLYNHRGEPLATVVAVNGDHLRLQGDAAKAQGIKVKGNALNDNWQLFRNEHAAFYSDPNPSRLDAAIEKYIHDHPADVLSTVLLIADYSDHSDWDKVNALLQSINLQARPESLTAALLGNHQNHKGANALPRMMSLTLSKHGGTFEDISLTGHVTLLHLWANPAKGRPTQVDKIKGLNTAIHVVDVLAEGDTLRWQQAISADPDTWQHYWAPGGPMEPGIQLLGINSAPWYAVIDSTGTVTYSGPNFSAAEKALNTALAPKQ